MSENQNFGFGKFIPGFDFLQDLAKGASQSLPQMPNLSSWVAPTLNLDELEKRIGELKAVHFWLDQNSKALGATIQALEVQKMTLATLKGMNFNMGEVANALQLKPADSPFGGAAKVRAAPADVAAQPAEAAERPKPARRTEKDAKDAAPPAGGVVDPLQWWGALTQQFQQIATGAMKDVAAQTAGSEAGGTAAAKAAARKAPAKAGNDKAASGAKRSGRKPSHP